MAAHRYFGTSAITALTVQSTLGVAATHPVSPEILAHTLAHLAEDLPPAGVKIGMMATEANVRVVAEFVRKLLFGPEKIPVVLDPVLRSTSGRELLDPAGLDALRRELLPLVDWVTPNLAELAALLGTQLQSESEVESAARELSNLGRGLNVVVTGGDHTASDLAFLADGHHQWLRGEKLLSSSTHGTGCAFSTSLLCQLVNGATGLDAPRQAKHYVTEAIRRATPIGSGTGPMNLLWPLE
jgi:hydroxymethylpyrimidine/phosphomethylpyrimidine kinase